MATENYTSDGSFTVPSNVTEVTIECRGGRSNASSSIYEGKGGLVEGTLNVSPGQTLYVRINDDGGVGGPDGAGGGNGAGSVDVRSGGTGLNDRIAVGAGGGGHGADDDGVARGGGDGGADTGQDGYGDSVANGHGGTQTSGGSGGLAQDGSFGAGGDGATYGGGGGGGWYGGGGASDDASTGAGGGGGSNYDDGLTTVQTNQRGGSNGQEVIISYTELPAAPDNPSQSVSGDDAIDLSWTEDTSAGDPAGYDIQVSEDGGSYTSVATVSGSTTTYAYSASPSTNSHRFRVRASNSAGTSNWAYTQTVYTDPRSLSVTSTASREISLSWTGVRDAADYDVLRAQSSGASEGDYSAVSAVSTTSFTDSGLEDGEQYYYRIQANYSGTDSQLTNEVQSTTPLPAPTLDSLDPSVDREITLNYTLQDNSTDGSVTIEVSTDGGSTWSDDGTVTDLSATAYTDAGLLDGFEYTYRVRRDTDHVSATSGTLSAVTNLPAPTNLATVSKTASSFDVTWTANHNNGDTRVEIRRSSATTWSTDATVARTTESHTFSGLLNGEKYDMRVVAQTAERESVDT